MNVDNAAIFYEGDLCLVNPGQVNQEIFQYTLYEGGTLMDTTTLTFAHGSGEQVYTCGRYLWEQATVPAGAANGTSYNFIDLSTRLTYTQRARFSNNGT